MCTEHGSVIGGPIEAGVRGDVVAVEVLVAEDARGEGRDLGHEGDGVLEGVLPQGGLFPLAGGVNLVEGTLALQGKDTDGQLGHGVHSFGEVIDDVDDVGGELGALVKLLRESLGLLSGGDVAGEQQPKSSLRKTDVAAGVLWELGVALVQVVAAVFDTLVRVEVGGLGEHTGDAAHAAHRHFDSDFAFFADIITHTVDAS